MSSAVAVDPVIGTSPIELDVEPSLRGRLAGLAKDRPLIIDYYASMHRGLTVGDLSVRFGDLGEEPRYVGLEPLEGVLVFAERSLLDLLVGATLREAGLHFARHLAISLAQPERWIEFFETPPGPAGIGETWPLRGSQGWPWRCSTAGV